MRKRRYKLLSLCIIVLSIFGFSAKAKDDIYIAPYHGAYSIELHKVNESANGITNATGTLTYTLKQDCLGWVSQTSIFIDVIFENGTSQSIISNLSSYESFDGWEYSFANENYTPDKNSLIHAGNVNFSVKDNHATVNFSEPKKQQALQLPITTLFPVALYKNIIRAENQNIFHFKAPYFDGSTPTELFNASVFLTSSAPDISKDITGDTSLLLNQKSTKASIAFFSKKDGNVPQFESQFEILNNGVLVNMIQSLGPIDVKLKLQDIKPLSHTKCDIQ